MRVHYEETGWWLGDLGRVPPPPFVTLGGPLSLSGPQMSHRYLERAKAASPQSHSCSNCFLRGLPTNGRSKFLSSPGRPLLTPPFIQVRHLQALGLATFLTSPAGPAPPPTQTFCVSSSPLRVFAFVIPLPATFSLLVFAWLTLLQE